MKRVLLLAVLLMCCTGAAWATVPVGPYYISYACTGSYGPYSFTFPISDPTALTVEINYVVVASTNYTIVPVNNQYVNGGSITLTTGYGACMSGSTLVLRRVTPLNQLTQYYNNMPTPFTAFGNSLDKLTEITQEIWGRTVHFIQVQNNGTSIGVQPLSGEVIFNFIGCTASVVQTGLPPTNVNNYTISCSGGGGGGISITGTAPIVVTPSPITGTGVISCPTCSTGGTIAHTTNVLEGDGSGNAVASTIVDDGTNTTQTPNGLSTEAKGLNQLVANANPGTVLNDPVCINASHQAFDCATTNTTGIAGTAGQGAGNSGNVRYCITQCSANFDGATTINDIAIKSTTTTGFHDTGSSTCVAGVDNFVVDQTIATAGVATIDILTPRNTCKSSSQATIIKFNGGLAATISNFNGSTPSPDASFIADTFKVTTALGVTSAIVETPYGTNSAKGVVECDGSTITCSGGVISASGASSVPFNTITTGTNTTATMTVGSGATLKPSSASAGVVSANEINGVSLAVLGTGPLKNTTSTGVPSIAAYTDIVTLWASGSCSGYLKSDGTCSTSSASVPFSGITSGTNTTAAMVVGSGGTLAPTSATVGVISANQINGTSLAGLSTGPLKNTTTTGVPSIAAYADIVTLWASGSCSGYLKNDGTCSTPGGIPYPSGTGIPRVVSGTSWGTTAELSGDATTSGSNAVTVLKINGGSTQAAVNYSLAEKAIDSAWNNLSSAAAQYFSSAYSGTIPANWSGTTAGTSALKCKTLPSATITWTVKDETSSTTLGTFAITSGGSVTLATTGGTTATLTATNVVSVTPSATDSSAIGCVFTGYFTVTGP